jgi:hypothetical protein
MGRWIGSDNTTSAASRSDLGLSEAEIEAVATRVADLLKAQRPDAELVDAAAIARRFGVSRDFVYEHADELGAVRLGDGPKARLRFDPAKVGRVLRKPPEKPAPRARRRATRRSSSLLPIRKR